MMKKLARRIFSVLLAAVILICSCPMVNAASVDEEYEERRERAMTVLLDSGWTEEDIADLITEEELMSYADVVSVENSEKKYFRVSEESSEEITYEECQTELDAVGERVREKIDLAPPAITTLGNQIPVGGDAIDTEISGNSYMEYYVRVYNCGGGEYKCQARFEWLTAPLCTQKDVFALIHSDDLTSNTYSSSYYFVYKADYSLYSSLKNETGTLIVEDPEEYTRKESDAGLAVTFDLADNVYEDGYNCTYSGHRGYMSYTASSDGTKNGSVFAEYYHKRTTVVGTPGVSIDYSGVTISGSADIVSSYEEMENNPLVDFVIVE